MSWHSHAYLKMRFCVSTLVATLLGLVMVEGAAAKTADEIRAVCQAEGRPCVGLVLSGGGARGFAHVGVLRVLEELGIKVDVVTGTSMGSMVGGAYAAGYTVAELEDTVTGVDWNQMLSPSAKRRLSSWRAKEDSYKSLPSRGIEIGTDGAVKLPAAFVPSEELELFLSRETGPVDNVHDLSDLAIPFAAPATDLVTGRRVVMRENCTLHEAMRASMSVPGAFAPAKHYDTLLVDGGLVDNLPVALAREMGADVVIAVNVGTPLSGRETLTNVVGVMAQMVNILTEQNVRASLASLHEDDILITPDLEKYSSADLDRSREIMDQGEVAARAAIEKLRVFARPRAQWQMWEEARTNRYAPMKYNTVKVANVEVEKTKNAQVSQTRILESASIRENSTQSVRSLDAAMRGVFADGYFDSVTYRLEPGPNGTSTVVIEPRERELARSSIRFGGSLETDFDRVSAFNALFAHSWGLINSLGAEWRNEIQIGETQRFLTEFYQPLGQTMPLFIQPSISYERHAYDVYPRDAGSHAIARWKNAVLDARVMLGWEFARVGYAALTGGWMRARTTREVGEYLPSWHNVEGAYVGGELFLDTLDSASFPTKGYRIVASGKITNTETEATGGNSHVFEVNALVPWSWGHTTALLEGKAGQATLSGMFQLGGAGRMVGAPYGRWSGARLEYGRAALAQNVADGLHVPVPVWVGLQGEVGRAWDDHRVNSIEESEHDWQKSLSLYVGVDSLIGPVILTFGRTMGEGSGLYFLWGYRY